MTLPETTVVGVAVLIGLAALGFWFAMIRHCWRTTPPGSRERWAWLLIVVLGKIPGALGYFLLRGKTLPTEKLTLRAG